MDAQLYPCEDVPPVGQFIVDGIKSGSIWLHLQYHDSTANNICKVQFGKSLTRVYQEDYFFTVTLAKEVPRNTQILLLFPATREVLDLSKTRNLHDINRYIDEHLGKDPKMAQLVLCLGSIMYKLDGVDGRLYLHWAEVLEYVSDRHPNRWMQTPLLASTDRHFKMTGLYPVFGQHMLQRFIHPDCSTFYVPRRYVVWSLDTVSPAPPLEHEAMQTATVVNRAQRDIIPDHEAAKYQRRTGHIDSGKNDADTGSKKQIAIWSRARALDASTTSEEYEPIVVTISELPTPRPFAQTNAVAAALNSGFFDVDDTSDSQSSPALSQATPRPSSWSADFDTTRSVQAEEMKFLTSMLNTPLLGLYSSPKDSQALRKTPKSAGSGE
jgi:hypothetical protein